jgi:S-adenosylmethionine:tRNA-ribosyltransferase-isomerase (queuine synthetase)
MNIKMDDRVYIQLKTHNIKQVPQVQEAILKYFNNNDVMKAQFNTQRNELLQQIHICTVENQRIDSLAKVSYFKDADKQLRFEKDKLLVGEQKKQLFFEELLRLQEIKANAEMRLTNLTQPMVLPSGLVVNPIPINGRIKYEEWSIIFGCFVALILSLLIENFDKILKFLNKK